MKQVSMVTTYTFGILLSTILTLIAYILVQIHINSHHKILPHVFLIPLVLGLAFLQLCVQLFFFLHLWKKDSVSRLSLGFFITTFLGILVIVIGSIWIMYHLNYNMTPQQMNQYINDQSGF